MPNLGWRIKTWRYSHNSSASFNSISEFQIKGGMRNLLTDLSIWTEALTMHTGFSKFINIGQIGEQIICLTSTVVCLPGRTGTCEITASSCWSYIWIFGTGFKKQMATPWWNMIFPWYQIGHITRSKQGDLVCWTHHVRAKLITIWVNAMCKPSFCIEICLHSQMDRKKTPYKNTRLIRTRQPEFKLRISSFYKTKMKYCLFFLHLLSWEAQAI